VSTGTGTAAPSTCDPDGLAAVLFDMDGTLIDSEKVWSVALVELAVEYGGALSDEARLAMVGTSEA
jgi:beta-phosphoglucomutase-like phosphatase (HAD superfamily)